MASHARARHPRDFGIETTNCAARVCDRRQPCSARDEHSVELGANDGGCAAAAVLKDNSSNSSTRLTLLLVIVAVLSLAGVDGGGGFEWNTL